MNSLFSSVQEYDIFLLRFIHHNRIVSLDYFFYIFSYGTSFLSATLILTCLFLSYYWKSIKLRNIFFKLLSVFLVVAITSLTLKILFSRDRPFITYPDITKMSEAGSSSFPSGHTMEAFAIAFAIYYLFKERMFTILIFSWAILVAYTRMALGVHYPLDVLAGIFIGTSTSFITLKVYERIEWKIKKG